MSREKLGGRPDEVNGSTVVLRCLRQTRRLYKYETCSVWVAATKKNILRHCGKVVRGGTERSNGWQRGNYSIPFQLSQTDTAHALLPWLLSHPLWCRRAVSSSPRLSVVAISPTIILSLQRTITLHGFEGYVHCCQLHLTIPAATCPDPIYPAFSSSQARPSSRSLSALFLGLPHISTQRFRRSEHHANMICWCLPPPNLGDIGISNVT